MSREVVYGRNPVRELIAARRREIHEVWAIDELVSQDWIAERRPRVATKAELGQACGSADHQGICAFTDAYPYVDAGEVLDAGGPVLCLDRVHDPRNLGAVARVADALGAAGIVIPRRGSPGVTGAVCKASAGAVEHVRLAMIENVASFLHDARGPRRWVVGADAGAGDDYRQIVWSPDTVIALGAEGEGLRPRTRSMCDQLVRIPMSGHVGSLNLSVAAALLLAEANRTP